METILKADIFFFIASIGTILAIAFLALLTYYLYKLIREARELIATIHLEIEGISDELRDVKEEISSKIDFVTKFLGIVTSAKFFKKVMRRRK